MNFEIKAYFIFSLKLNIWKVRLTMMKHYNETIPEKCPLTRDSSILCMA